MKYRLAFVGIDRFSDPQIRDLSGAANDAKALWGLFADTLPDADAHLLVNEEATATAMREAFNRALLDPTDEDVALIFFAGHGTRDHRLVVHDTNRLALSNTTIPMEEVAELFKKTKARVAILILDCCFSDGVTARVLDDSPSSRDFHDLLLGLSAQRLSSSPCLE